jgi:hypothetical protein
MNNNSEYEIKSLHFNTAFRNSGSLSNPSFILNEPVNNLVAVKVKNCVMPLAYYTFDNHNNKLYLVEDTDPVVEVSILKGNYSSSTISAALKTALELSGALTYTVSYSSLTNKINITSATQFKFLSGNSDAYYELGITTTDLNAFSVDFTPSEVIDLSGPKIVHLVSNVGITKCVNQNYNILCSVITEEDNLSISSYEDNSSDYINVRNQQLTDFQISVYDDRLRALTPHKDFNLTVYFLVK